MAVYCEIGQKPKVYFHFGNNADQVYESAESPIDVSLENYSIYSDNYSAAGYRVSFYSPNNGITVTRTVRAYKITDLGSGYPADSRYVFSEIGCNSTTFQDITNITPNSLTVNTAITCPTSVPDILRSKLHIKRAGETTDIFTATGNYPGTFKVACVDCPSGTCRCDCDNYPGYCCINIDEFKGEFRGMRNDLRSKFDG